ncbi:MAG: MMPL family transporter [Devosia nanyangense]|nr:MMPL family transporter [Devosia nanyangense]
MAKDSLALDAATEIDAGVGGVAPIYVRVPLIDAAPEMTDADFEIVRKIHEIVEKHLGQNKVISAASFSHYQDSGFTRQDVLDSVGAFMKRRFITEDGKQALVTGFMPTIIASEDLRRLVDDLHAEIDAAGIKGTEIGGFRILATFATENIVQGLQLDLTVSVLVNLFLIGFAFRSLRVATATAIPNLFPVLGAEAFLWWSGAGLQLTTVLSLTIAFGIAVDDTTHFLSHYLHARREEGRDHNEAVKHTMERIGGAIVATTLILCSGTGIVATSNLPQVALFGTLFVITLALALIGDVFILPALLVAGGKFFHPLGGIRK